MKSVKEWIKLKLPGTVRLVKKLTAKKWSEKSIAYYVGNHHEGLTPDRLKDGASGSHIAVVLLAKEWTKLGHKVTVYSNCGDKEGIYDGVEYLNYYRMNWQDSFDTLIIWKNPKLLKRSINVKAKRIWFDWHDVVYPPEAFSRAQLERFDKIFAKSQYQRNLLPDLPSSKFSIITNGVSQSLQELSDKPKDPYKLIYTSRYYRGLEMMLTYGWSIIQREIPEAQLHIYYGWTRRDNFPERAEWRQKMERLMDQPGVLEHGMVGQDKLILEKATSTIHYYACTYEEIDCISVRESAMLGCVPVTTDYAALSEKQYCLKIPGEPSDQKTQEAVAEKIVELLQNPQKLELIRQQYIEAVKMETWSNLAPLWLKNQR